MSEPQVSNAAPLTAAAEILALLRRIEGRPEPLGSTPAILSLLATLHGREMALPPPPVVTPTVPLAAPPRRPTVVRRAPARSVPVREFFDSVAWDGSGRPIKKPAASASPRSVANPNFISVRQFFATVHWDGRPHAPAAPPAVVRVPAMPVGEMPPPPHRPPNSVTDFFSAVRWDAPNSPKSSAVAGAPKDGSNVG